MDALQTCIVNSNGDNTELERMLKGLSVDINAFNSEGKTLLHIAASLGFDDCIYTLFQYGAHLDQYSIVELHFSLEFRVKNKRVIMQRRRRNRTQLSILNR